MNNTENKDIFDLGSSPISEDFDPFAMENESEDNTIQQEISAPEQIKQKLQ